MTLVIKTVGHNQYLYDYTKVQGKTKAKYLGKVGDPKTEEKVKSLSHTTEKNLPDDHKKSIEKDLNILPPNENEIIFKKGWESHLKKEWDQAKVRNLDFRGIRNRGQFSKKVGVNAGMELYLGDMKVKGIPIRKHTKVEIVDPSSQEILDVQTNLDGLKDSIKTLIQDHPSLTLEFSGENYVKGDIVYGQTFKEIQIRREEIK